MSWLNEFHFLRPYWLLALFIPVLLSMVMRKNDSVYSSWAKVCDEQLLKYLLVTGSDKQRKLPYILAILISFLIIIALAGPTWVKKRNPVLSVVNPVMVLLNLSHNMWGKDVKPSRVVRSEYVIKDILQEFKTTETGMIVYSKEPFLISPLAEDVSLVENILPQLEQNIMPENGDRLDRAIDMAVSRMQAAGFAKGNLIVLTADVGERFDAALESAAKAYNEGFEVNVIKVSGDANDKLEMLAKKGGGVYLNYNKSYKALIDKINSIYEQELKQSDNIQTVWEDMGYYLLWLPAVILLYYFRKGVIISGVVLVLSYNAYAGMFLNNNQEAMKYFESGEYAKAADKFENTQWKAAAAYKNGDFSSAYENFAKFNDTTALYNQGNALAKSGKIKEAIAKYEEVLKQDKDFADAAFNLEYLKKQQQQQNKEQQQNKQNQQNQQNEEQNNQSQNTDKQQEQNQQKQEQPEQNQSQSANEQQLQNSENQQSEKNETQSAEANEAQQQSTGTDDKQNNDNSNAENKNTAESRQVEASENKASENPAETEQTASYGNKDDDGKQSAEAAQIKFGDSAEEKSEKMKVRMQKFRDIPEDKGGLLRAIINKEYRLNRYNEK